jgi:hypothetical protein
MYASLSAKARFFSQTWSTMLSRSITSLVALYNIWVGLRYHIIRVSIKEKHKNLPVPFYYVSVVVQHWFQCGPASSILGQWDPDPDS